MSVTPIDLFASSIHLGQEGRIRAGRRTADPDQDGWRLTAFHARTGADVHVGHWEVHPEAEEIVSCLVGKIRLFLRPEGPGQQEEEVRLTAGTAAIVPRGRWHRIELDIPSTIMAVTLPRGSRLERRAEAQAGAPARPPA
ncbi:cupin [Nonomuraea wenchangensis]